MSSKALAAPPRTQQSSASPHSNFQTENSVVLRRKTANVIMAKLIISGRQYSRVPGGLFPLSMTKQKAKGSRRVRHTTTNTRSKARFLPASGGIPLRMESAGSIVEEGIVLQSRRGTSTERKVHCQDPEAPRKRIGTLQRGKAVALFSEDDIMSSKSTAVADVSSFIKDCG